MDLFTVNQDGSQGPQIHDFNPGIPTSGFSRGLFWTQHIPIDSVTVNLGNATASLELTGLPVKDFFNVRNSFLNFLPPNQQPPGVVRPVPAFLDLSMRWNGKKAHVDVTDFEDTDLTSNHRFVGAFIEDTATIQWSVTVPTVNFEFRSDSTKTFESEFAEIGRERNGVFFRPGRID
jgi:hypothetical protein